MRIKSLLVALFLAFGLIGSLVVLLNNTPSTAQASPLEPSPPFPQGEGGWGVRVMAPNTATFRYVAITGTDTTDCANSAAPCRTVQYAVDQAYDSDEIRVATGIYTGVNAYGGSSQVVYISKTVSVRGGYTTTNWTAPNPISCPTTLDAQAQGRVMYITGSISPTVEGLRITGGQASSGGGIYIATAAATISNCQVISNEGSGVYLYYSPATLTGNIVSNNTARQDENGGGLYLNNSSARIISNTISNNSSVFGGGLYLEYCSDVMVSGNVISGNIANEHSGSGGGHGGGVYLVYGSNVVFNGNLVSSNTAKNWVGGALLHTYSNIMLDGNLVISNTANGSFGGLYLDSNNTILKNNIIAHNTATFLGGGLGLSGNAILSKNSISSNVADSLGGGLVQSSGAAQLVENTIISNTAGEMGGGALLRGNYTMLTNTIIANNHADISGGGLYIWNSSSHLLHTTIVGNTAGDGSGIFVEHDSSSYLTTLAMTNTILVSHTIGISASAGSTVDINGILWYSTPITIAQSPAATVTVQNEYWGDPAFCSGTGWGKSSGEGWGEGWGEACLAPNPAPNDTPYHLTSASAAIDRGVPAGVFTDIDGDPRPLGNGFDLGADESPFSLLAPGSPILLAPPNGTITAAQAITLAWQAGAGSLPDGYNLKLGNTIITTTNTSSPTLLPLGVHTWTVRAFNAAGYSNWVTPAWTIEVTTGLTAPGVPVLFSPPSGTVTTTQAITFAWQAGSGNPPEGYNLQLDGAMFTTTNTSSPTLLPLGVHIWTVRAFNAAGYSAWVAPAWTVEITTGLTAPGMLVLLSPPSGTVTTTQTITFAWQSGAGELPDGYNLKLDNTTITTTNTISPAILSVGVHTWTVRAFNAAGYSAWASPAWTVEVKQYRTYLPIVARDLPPLPRYVAVTGADTTDCTNSGGDGSGIYVAREEEGLWFSAWLTDTILVSHTIGITATSATLVRLGLRIK